MIMQQISLVAQTVSQFNLWSKLFFNFTYTQMQKYFLIIPLIIISSTNHVFAQSYERNAYRFMRNVVPRLMQEQDEVVPKILRYTAVKEFFLDDFLTLGPYLPKELAPELNISNKDYLLEQYSYWSQVNSLNSFKLGVPANQLRITEARSFDAQLELIRRSATQHVFFPPLFTLDGNYAFFYHINSSGETGMLIYRKAKHNTWEQCYYYQIVKS